MTADQHAADHQRLDAAFAAWDALGRPAGRITGRNANAKLHARRTFGLRMQAHMAVFHHVRLPIGWGMAETHAAHAEGSR